MDLEEIMLKLRQITSNLKPPDIMNRMEQDQMENLWEWLQLTLSTERFRMMSDNIQSLAESDLQQKAKEIELLALQLDIEQAHEINRGKEFNIIKK